MAYLESMAIAELREDNPEGTHIDGSELTGEPETFYVYVPEDADVRPEICWTEYIAFHAERAPEILGVDGWPTVGFMGALEDELRRILATEFVYVSEASGDEPGVEIAVGLRVLDRWTVGTMLGNVAWPYIARLHNVFDPGTFGCEYVVNSALAAMRGE